MTSETWSTKYGADHSLSQIFVKEGYFPLYGMPEREVALLTEDPNTGKNHREWPIQEGKISRSEDIAIAEFAPDQEYLQDKRRFRSTSVTWLEKVRGRISVREPSKYQVRELYICSSCSRVTEDIQLVCEACGSKSIEYFHCLRPEFYISADPKGYTGHIESSPQTIITTPAPEARSDEVCSNTIGNSVISSMFGNVIRINSNANAGFTRVGENDQARPSVVTSASGLTGLIPASGSNAVAGEKFALFSEQHTSLMAISLDQVPGYIHSSRDFRALSVVNSAHRSMAELLRIGITLLEDIEPNELSASVQKEGANWSIYISDTLDNGSGYSAKYSAPESFTNLVEYISAVYATHFLKAHSHESSCISSCYKCLRTYENRLAHASLDWRLALDLLNVYLGGFEESRPLGPYWKSVIQQSGLILKNLLGLERFSEIESHEPIFAFDRNGQQIGLLIRHPLLTDGAGSIRLRNEIKDSCSLDDVYPINPYFLIRNPVGELSHALNFYKGFSDSDKSSS